MGVLPHPSATDEAFSSFLPCPIPSLWVPPPYEVAVIGWDLMNDCKCLLYLELPVIVICHVNHTQPFGIYKIISLSLYWLFLPCSANLKVFACPIFLGGACPCFLNSIHMITFGLHSMMGSRKVWCHRLSGFLLLLGWKPHFLAIFYIVGRSSTFSSG